MAKKEKTFEESLAELEEIVGALEGGELPLEKSIKRYGDGVKLLKKCYGFLEKADKNIRKLVKSDEGTFSFEDCDDGQESE